MPKIIQNPENKKFDEIVKSKKFQEAYEKEHRSLLIVAMMQDAIEKHRITQTEVAARMGVSQADVSKIINGKKKNFTVETLVRFCDAIGSGIVIS